MIFWCAAQPLFLSRSSHSDSSGFLKEAEHSRCPPPQGDDEPDGFQVDSPESDSEMTLGYFWTWHTTLVSHLHFLYTMSALINVK